MHEKLKTLNSVGIHSVEEFLMASVIPGAIARFAQLLQITEEEVKSMLETIKTDMGEEAVENLFRADGSGGCCGSHCGCH